MISSPRPSSSTRSPNGFKTDTPTYSVDRLNISSSCPTLKCLTESDAKSILVETAIFRSPPFQQRFKNNWDSVLVQVNGEYDLDSSLKKCYSIAFAMPPSPNFRARSNSLNQSPPSSLAIWQVFQYQCRNRKNHTVGHQKRMDLLIQKIYFVFL